MTHYIPLVILGAPRSGTNMLRDVLTSLEGFATWDCDEIDAVWRYGNYGCRDDVLTRSEATPDARSYIRRRFDRLARRSGAHVVVEKTCANTLRVDFIDAVLPDARYLVITRDGEDVVASAERRWRAETDWRYTLDKARHVPLKGVPTFLGQFVRRRLPGSHATAWWGPRPQGWRDHQEAPVAARAAFQWARCLDATATTLPAVEPARWDVVAYEDLVRSPAVILRAAMQRLALPTVDSRQLAAATAMIRTDSVGKGSPAKTAWADDVAPHLVRGAAARRAIHAQAPPRGEGG